MLEQSSADLQERVRREYEGDEESHAGAAVQGVADRAEVGDVEPDLAADLAGKHRVWVGSPVGVALEDVGHLVAADA